MMESKISNYLGEYYSSTPNLVRVFKILRDSMHPSEGGDIESYADLTAEFAVALYSRHVRAARALHGQRREQGIPCPLVPLVDALEMYATIRDATLERMQCYNKVVDNAAPLVQDEHVPTIEVIPTWDLMEMFRTLNPALQDARYWHRHYSNQYG